MIRETMKKKTGLLLTAASLAIAVLLTGCVGGNAAQESKEPEESFAASTTPQESGAQAASEPEDSTDAAASTDAAPTGTGAAVPEHQQAGPATVGEREIASASSRTTGSAPRQTATPSSTAVSRATTRRSTLPSALQTTRKTTQVTVNRTTTTRQTTAAQPTKTTAAVTGRPDSSLAAYRDEILRLVNAERQKAGVSPLTADSGLNKAAQVRADEIIVKFDHTRPDGSKFSTALQQAGVSYRTAGENIAMGQRSPAEVMNGWMNSDGHRKNILNAGYGKLGVGYVVGSNGRAHWVQLFTN